MASEARRVLTGHHFMNGDEACAEGALAAGCTFFAGYPITPSTEVAERMARRLPQVGGYYVQMEDELGSMAAVLGAAWAGARAMTATSGPGFTLMMENIGLGIFTETPCVVVDVQRGAPSTGLPTLVGQGDVMQARWGSHGHYEIIAYAPSSPQECFDLTVKAFNTADRFRLPVLVMSDEVVGHMMERVVIPPAEEIAIVRPKRPATPPENGWRPYEPEADLIPSMPLPGQGYRIHVTGLTHDERGYPVTDAETQDRLVRRLVDKVLGWAKEIIEYEEYLLSDAEVAVVAYGCTARSARRAVNIAREQGLPVGLLRLITLWPFPEERVRALAEQVGAFVVPELNLGQMAREVERFTSSPVLWVGHGGGAMLPPEPILAALREAMAAGGTPRPDVSGRGDPAGPRRRSQAVAAVLPRKDRARRRGSSP